MHRFSWRWLFSRKTWKTPPTVLGGISRWTKETSLNQRSPFERARFGKYDKPRYSLFIARLVIILCLCIGIIWFVWSSWPAFFIFK